MNASDRPAPREGGGAAPTPDEHAFEQGWDYEPQLRPRHGRTCSNDPEIGCECGLADWLAENSPDREHHLAKLRSDYPNAWASFEDRETHPLAGDWILVELHRNSGDRWFTAHPTPEAATAYHDTQEHPEDWEAVELVDLTTGRRYKGRTMHLTTWEGLK